MKIINQGIINSVSRFLHADYISSCLGSEGYTLEMLSVDFFVLLFIFAILNTVFIILLDKLFNIRKKHLI